MGILWSGTQLFKKIHIRSGGEIDVKSGASLKLAGTALTPTATELNLLAGLATTAAELGYVSGVTSAIQTQMDLKAPKASPTFTGTVTVPAVTVSALQVVGARGATVADASGGATIDAEARAAINALLARVRAHGLIAT